MKKTLYVFCFFILSTLPVLSQTVRYVSTTGTNPFGATATSWANATNDLQGAINASAVNDQVWVRSGTYKPGDSPLSFFYMKNNVAIYGGFAGTETALSQRVLAATPTSILSGDIGTVGVASDNCNTIINNSVNGALNTSAILDGFTISDANGGTFGGGMYNYNSSPTIRNCLFQNNTVLACCGSGGAMNNWAQGGTASPVLINCSFLNNSASFGGAIYTYGATSGNSSPVLTNCSFQGNSASNGGQAIVVATNNGGTANPQATNCIIFGSILMTFSGTQPTFASTNCLIQPGAVGGVAAGNFSQTNNITSSVSPFVSTNTTQINDCSLVVNRGLNSAAGLSGITTDAGGNPRIRATTVDIGAYEALGNVPISITSQPAPEIWTCAGSNVSASVQVQGTVSGYQWFRQGPSGPATPVSGATGATLTLANAQTAVTGTYYVVVTGCYSLTSNNFSLFVNGPLFVTPGGAGSQNGSSWANAYPGNSLQTAINAAQSTCGKQVWVAAGTYKPTINNTPTTDRDATYTMRPDVAIYGGFVGNETFLSNRPAISLTVPPSTTLSADVANNTNVSAYNLFRNGDGLTRTAVLDGFVLAFALANNTGSQQGKSSGGAMYNSSSTDLGSCSPTVRNCWFMNNYALYGGAAIANNAVNGGDASPQIENCRFQTNIVQAGSGGAVPVSALAGADDARLLSRSAV